MKVICNKRHVCGNEECPHATEHEPFDVTLCLDVAVCSVLLQKPGFGKVKSRCQCEPVARDGDEEADGD